MTKKRLIFIANPISGTQQKQKILLLIKKLINEDLFEYTIVYTEAAGHATVLAADAVKMGYDVVVAIGGDGTVNEVGQSLLNTPVALGIIPAGSGNGFARHLGISTDPKKAIKQLMNMQIETVDNAILNEQAFFCTAGVGFDAAVSHAFAQQAKRGLWTYVQTCLSVYSNYRPELYEIKIDKNSVVSKEAFLITVANAAQFGNNAHIAPQASVQDGYLDICLIKPFKPSQRFLLGIALFNKTLHKLPFVEFYKAKQISIKTQNDAAIHIDGEPIGKNQVLNFSIQPSSLKVVIGKRDKQSI